MREVFICDAARTPIGRYGGALAKVRTDDLAAVPIKALVARNAKADWARLDEFLMAAEYIMSEGNYQVVLCERGVRTFTDHTRNTLDLSVVPAVQRLSHLPILVDPSHGTGKRNKVTPLSRAAVAVGADGLMIEVHHDPDRALSDGQESLFPDQFDQLVEETRQIARVVGRSIRERAAQFISAAKSAD